MLPFVSLSDWTSEKAIARRSCCVSMMKEKVKEWDSIDAVADGARLCCLRQGPTTTRETPG